MCIDTQGSDILPVIRTYGKIDEQNDENRITLDSLTHTDNNKNDILPY